MQVSVCIYTDPCCGVLASVFRKLEGGGGDELGPQPPKKKYVYIRIILEKDSKRFPIFPNFFLIPSLFFSLIFIFVSLSLPLPPEYSCAGDLLQNILSYISGRPDIRLVT